MSNPNYFIDLKIPANQIFNASKLIDFKATRASMDELSKLQYMKPEPFIITHDLITIKVPVKEEFFSHNAMKILLKEFFYRVKDLVKGRLYYEFQYFHPDENIFKCFVVSNYDTITEYRCEWELISSAYIDSTYEYYTSNNVWESFNQKIISIVNIYSNLIEVGKVKKIAMLARSDERKPHPIFVSKELDTWHIEIRKITDYNGKDLLS